MATLLSVNSYHYRRDGSEVVYLEHNRLFGEQGWRVVPFAMQHSRNLPSAWASYFPDEVELGSQYSWREKAVRAPRVVYSVQARKRLGQLVERVRPDVAHCHSIYHHLSPSVLDELRADRIPVVMTLHDLKVACPAYQMYSNGAVCERCNGGHLHNVVRHRCVKDSLGLSAIAWLEASVHKALNTYARSVTRFVSPSAFYVDKLVEWGWERDRFVHIPNFVDPSRFAPQLDPGRYIVYVGRLSAEKGLRTLVRAAALSKVPVRMVGEGPLAGELHALADALGATVTFRGRVEGAELWDELAGARAAVLPSEWYENAPMTVLESFALGKPVIGADLGGIPELVDASTGWLFPSGSADALAETLRRVAALPDRALRELGSNARERVVQQYSAERYVDRMTALYEDLGVTAPSVKGESRQ